MTITGATTGLNLFQYRAVATNSVGSANSAAAVLTVNATAPVFGTHPGSHSITVGDTTSFSAAATGNPSPSLKWQVSTDGGSIWTDLTNVAPYSGVTSGTLSITAAPLALNTAQYRAVATNSVSAVNSNAATLTVLGSVPAFTTQPQTQAISAGTDVTLTVVATGTPTPTLQWQKHEVNISGATSASFTLTNTTLADADSYRVVATNVAGTTNSNAATLTVNPVAPSYSVHPAGQSVIIGNNTTFSATVSGNPTPNLQWQVSTDSGSTWTDLTASAPYSGITTDPLSITGVSLSLTNYQYRLVVTNSAGSVTSNSAILTISTDTNPGTSPTSTTAQIWLMSGPNVLVQTPLAVGSSTWKAAAAADFNGDSRPDVMWQNVVTRQRLLWIMDGTKQSATRDFGIVDSRWQIRAGADFTGDGIAEILMQDALTGQSQIWFVQGSTLTFGFELGLTDPVWKIATAGDFTGDGKPEIVWENVITGQRLLWLMNGTGYTGEVNLGTFDLSWTIAAAADFDADGQTDLMWQNTVTGGRFVWLMSGISYKGEVQMPVADLNWSIAAAADFNADGHADVVTKQIATLGPATPLITPDAGSTPPPTQPGGTPIASSGGGGGGALSIWLLLALGALTACRRLRQKRT